MIDDINGQFLNKFLFIVGVICCSRSSSDLAKCATGDSIGPSSFLWTLRSCSVSGSHMQLIKIIKQKTDIHKEGNKYGYLPNSELPGNNFGYFSVGCARYPPITDPIIRPIAHDVLS
jgi:hypothetical protein